MGRNMRTSLTIRMSSGMRLFLFITFIVAGANGSPEPKPTPKPFWGGMLPPLGQMSPFPSFGGYGQYNPSGFESLPCLEGDCGRPIRTSFWNPDTHCPYCMHTLA